jgi:hypothetical protein
VLVVGVGEPFPHVLVDLLLVEGILLVLDEDEAIEKVNELNGLVLAILVLEVRQ